MGQSSSFCPCPCLSLMIWWVKWSGLRRDGLIICLFLLYFSGPTKSLQKSPSSSPPFPRPIPPSLPLHLFSPFTIHLLCHVCFPWGQFQLKSDHSGAIFSRPKNTTPPQPKIPSNPTTFQLRYPRPKNPTPFPPFPTPSHIHYRIQCPALTAVGLQNLASFDHNNDCSFAQHPFLFHPLPPNTPIYHTIGIIPCVDICIGSGYGILTYFETTIPHPNPPHPTSPFLPLPISSSSLNGQTQSSINNNKTHNIPISITKSLVFDFSLS